MSHYYDIDGNSVHEVPNVKGGGMRATRVTDAKKLGLFPSVTTYFDVLQKDGLKDYRDRQITMAAFMTHPKPLETPEQYHARIIQAADKDRYSAADLGTRIHKAIELHCAGEVYDSTLDVYVKAADEWMALNEIYPQEQELRLVNSKDGYAGTTDMRFTQNGRIGILDFKSRRTKAGEPVKSYETQPAQIAAYYVADQKTIDMAYGVNVYISTTEPGRIDAVWYEEKELIESWEFFKHIMAIWRHVKGFDPRIQ